MFIPTKHELRFIQSVALISWLCLVLFLGRMLLTGQLQFLFIPWNLSLAWLALVFGWLLVKEVQDGSWLSWKAVVLTFAWLVLLPNSWYVLTDFIHVRATGVISELYDIAMIGSLVTASFALGFASLYMVHKEILRRIGEAWSNFVIVLIILAASFAIYLGRDLRWNTWDVLANPGGLILNVSDRILDPLAHQRTLNVTALFFVFISTVYFAIWLSARPDRKR